MKDKPLFNENILAWEHGPVVNEVYQEYKQNGSNPIAFDEPYDIKKVDNETRAILEEVFDVFGQYSAWTLREMTHEEAPWKETVRNDVIDREKIKDFFKKEYIE